MALLKRLHNSGLVLKHDFDLHEEMLRYETYIREAGAVIPFEDYPEVRLHAEEVFRFVAAQQRPKTIAHIDSVKDNFIFTDEGLKMIDWEYCGMADPLTDLAMAAIYSYMSFEETKQLIEVYRTAPMGGADGDIALRGLDDEEAYALVVAYMGLGGLLWALWCIYKMALGESFGDYTLRMYRYFKDSYKFLRNSGKI